MIFSWFRMIFRRRLSWCVFDRCFPKAICHPDSKDVVKLQRSDRHMAGCAGLLIGPKSPSIRKQPGQATTTSIIVLDDLLTQYPKQQVSEISAAEHHRSQPHLA